MQMRTEYETTIKVAYGKDGVKTHDVALLSYMVGDYLAVHESQDDADMWTITHVPTGFACRSRIDSKSHAIDMAHEIKDLMDWDFLEPQEATNRKGFHDVLDVLYPDRERKPDPLSQDMEEDKVVKTGDSKLDMLLEIEGFLSPDQFLREFITDSLCPGICMNEGCDYTTMYEQDQTEGWCEECDTGSVQSGMILMGMI